MNEGGTHQDGIEIVGRSRRKKREEKIMMILITLLHDDGIKRASSHSIIYVMEYMFYSRCYRILLLSIN